MGQNSNIEWTHHTFNPWMGCTKVSPGCMHCYAEALMDGRWGKVQWGPNAVRVRTSPDNWKKPVAWNRAAEAAGERHRVFCASLADVFEDRDELACWRLELFALIKATPHLDWLLLTKRPECINRHLATAVTMAYGVPQQHGEFAAWLEGWLTWLDIPANVWIGTSVEDQQRADERIPELLKVPSEVRFLSMEPLLGPVDFEFYGDCPACGGDSIVGLRQDAADPFDWYCRRPGCADRYPMPSIDWVIAGGESGHAARPCNVNWIRNIMRKCQAAGVPVFVKQLGAVPYEDDSHVTGCKLDFSKLTRLPGAAMKDPKGGDIDEFPIDLRIRQFPSLTRKESECLC